MQADIKTLIVDDNPTNAAVLRAALEWMEIAIEPDMASNGRDAVDRLHDGFYDLVLLDLHMPEFNGTDVLRWMNSNLDIKPAVVVVTADDRLSMRREVEDLGCDGYLCKPISIQDLRAHVCEVLSRKQRPTPKG